MRTKILPTFYHELLTWWAELRETVDPDRGHGYILWNNKEILIEGKTVFYRHYFDYGVIFKKDLLYDITNTQSFKAGFHMIADDRRRSRIANRRSQTIAKRVVSI